MYKYGDCFQSADSCLLAEKLKEKQGVSLVVADSILHLSRIQRELEFFLSTEDIPVYTLPDWETLPYDQFSPHREIISERLSTLYQILTSKKCIVLAAVQTLMHLLCPKDYILSRVFKVKVGDNVCLEALRERLSGINYDLVPQVESQGEYSVRGSIIDIFPMGSDEAFRIDFFDNEVDEIRIFDVEDQKTIEKIQEINLLPAREYPFDKDSISEFRTNWREAFDSDPRLSPLYQEVSAGIMSAGVEYYLSLFFSELNTIFDYLPESANIFLLGNINTSVEEFYAGVSERSERFSLDNTRPILSKNQVYFEPQLFMQKLKEFSRTSLVHDSVEAGNTRENSGFTKIPDIALDIKKLDESKNKIDSYFSSKDVKVLFCAESSGRKQILEQLLINNGIKSDIVESWLDFQSSESKFSLCVAPISSGFTSDDFILVTEYELLGRQYHATRKRSKSAKFTDEYGIKNLAELKDNDLIVHIENGIGKYKGLTVITANGADTEFLTIEYADEAKLYVPVTSLHLVSHYSGAASENVTLNSLGSDKWRKAKEKAAKKATDTAAKLLEVYAKREIKNRQKFNEIGSDFDDFVSKFPYEETEDQIKATNDVVKDLCESRPMDRVICGDVGFGKTEVAMRASFIVAASGFQVAILVPTTLLAEQHYQSLINRFVDFPIEVAVLSRFQSRQEQAKILQSVSEGKIDIIVGTHRLIQNDVKFSKLGLLIIDEEHRFGVKQKEKFKELRAEVDILTLTATPIPRTLNMAMGGIRELSIIATPPSRRLAVKTFVREFNVNLVQEAIEREIQRGGQVFYLYNNVQGIEAKAREVASWAKGARVITAHGQMPEKLLEDTMNDFYHQRADVLVCTTIIETGIDIPTANTIIIERADKFGLAQLHQLRGRVGRSHHQAFAFCLTPSESAITSDAKKRLEAIESLETLGSGFTLASHDLEIRGAGDLLGDDQSGHIQEIGFQLYMDMLNKAVSALKDGKNISNGTMDSYDIDINVPAIFPDTYLPDVNMRLVLYKRLSNVTNKEELNSLRLEIVDRFGKLPDSVENLINLSTFKLTMQDMGISSIKLSKKGGKISFEKKPKVNPDKIINLIKSEPNSYSFDGPLEVKIRKDLLEPKDRLDYVDGLLKVLA